MDGQILKLLCQEQGLFPQLKRASHSFLIKSTKYMQLCRHKGLVQWSTVSCTLWITVKASAKYSYATLKDLLNLPPLIKKLVIVLLQFGLGYWITWVAKSPDICLQTPIPILAPGLSPDNLIKVGYIPSFLGVIRFNLCLTCLVTAVH